VAVRSPLEAGTLSRVGGVEPATREDLVAACCADLYGHDLVARLLGPSYHPGGHELTRAIARTACLRPGERVLDVASGPGTSALLLAREFGAHVRGVDLSAPLVRRANEAAEEQGLASQVVFEVANAVRLPVQDAAVDAVLCECALCIFPDKRSAVSEMARVLTPGGRLLLSDVVLDRDDLPDELRTFAARVACLADALPLDGYLRLLEEAGLRVCSVERRDEALVHMVQEIEARLSMLASVGVTSGMDTSYVRSIARSAVDVIDRGLAGYVLLIAELAPASGMGAA